MIDKNEQIVIDTDRYEGHIEGPWDYYDSGGLTDYRGEYTMKILHKPYDNDDTEYELANVLTEWESGHLPTTKLIADAPILLAEVKRLRSYIAHNNGDKYRQCPECGSIDFDFKFNHKELECKCDNCDYTWKELIE